MSTRKFASSLIAPMSTEPRLDCSEMTFHTPKSSEDFNTAAEIAANTRESYRIPDIFVSNYAI